MNKCVSTSTSPEVNVWLMTTASDTWLFQCLVVNCMNAKKVPGAYPYRNHYRNFVDLVKPQKFNTTKQFLCKLFLT